MDDKDQIIIEFITKTQGLAYKNQFGTCAFCGGPRKVDDMGHFQPLHYDWCLYERAKRLVSPHLKTVGTLSPPSKKELLK